MPEPLEIPVRLDHKPAVEGLGKIKEGGEEAGKGIGELLEAFGAVELAKEGFEMVSKVVEGMAESLNKAAEFTAKCAEEFINVQKTMQGLAAMTGHQGTNAFSEEEIKSGGPTSVPKIGSHSKKRFSKNRKSTSVTRLARFSPAKRPKNLRLQWRNMPA